MKLAAFAVPVLLATLATGSPGQSQPTASAAALCAGPPAAPTPAFGGTTRARLDAAPVTFTNRWASAGKPVFSHVIEGRPGRVHLTLETCSSATGGETVAIYPATAAGQRMPRKPRVMFSIAVPRGNVRHAIVTIPAARSGIGSVHIAVVVENASGRFHQGAYRLTASR
ncbi:MAG TPA: hypothetical protein VGD23_04865 [Sphingomicrobium sp.]